jgi:hypothetical protein
MKKKRRTVFIGPLEVQTELPMRILKDKSFWKELFAMMDARREEEGRDVAPSCLRGAIKTNVVDER